MSTTYTTNYHLGKQTDTSDTFDMSVITDNMDIIDTQMKSNENNISLKANTSDVNTATANLQAQINQIAEKVHKDIGDSDLTQNYYIQLNGTLTSNSNFHVSDMIPYISDMKSITITKSSSLPGGCAVAFYTESSFSIDAFISGVSLESEVSNVPVSVSIPNGTRYIAFSARKSTEFKARIECGVGVKVDNTFTSPLFPPSSKAVADKNESSWEKRIIECDTVTPNVHFSVDDVIYAFYDLTTNTPESIWDNDFFAQLKELHDTYGICITCNCFIYLSSINFRLSSVPNTWADEFKAVKDWLRFAFHGSDNKVYSDNAIIDDYEEFVADIYAITGDYGCIDTVTRTQSFTGSLENCNAMKNIDYGITVFLTADDTRNSYYLNTEQSAKAYRRGKYIDALNNNMFIKTFPRLDTNGLAAIQAEIAAYPATAKYAEIFAHEPMDSTPINFGVYANIIKPVCAWFMNTQNYTSNFLMDIFK